MSITMNSGTLSQQDRTCALNVHLAGKAIVALVTATLVVGCNHLNGFTLPYDGSVETDGRAFTVSNTGEGDAVTGASYGEHGKGVHGRANAQGDVENYGGYFLAKGARGIGVLGAADNFDGANFGGKFVTNAIEGTGVYGEANHTGAGLNYGGFFQSRGQKGVGVYGEALGSAAYGVYGWAKEQGDAVTYGGYFKASANQARGVYAISPFWGVAGVATGENGKAVYGEATKVGGVANYGGYFVARGDEGRGIYARGGPDGNAAELRGNVSIYDWYSGNLRVELVPGGPARTAAVFRGNVAIRNWDDNEVLVELGEGLDLAEGFDVFADNEIRAGSVLVIDPDHPGRLALSNRAYDTRVAGVVSGARGLGSAVSIAPQGFDYPVALAGRVYCSVDASDESIRPGDLLTTSGRPGYAMKAVDAARSGGAILGKAMESVEKGETAQILVLVTLQ